MFFIATPKEDQKSKCKAKEVIAARRDSAILIFDL